MGNKAVIYLLPGLLCDATVWQHQCSALAPMMDVRVPDFRGMNSFRAMALQVLADAPARFSIVGHSMGGRVGLELLHLAGDRIDKVVLMDLGAHAVQAGEVEERMVLVELAELQGMAALAEAWIPPMIAESRHDDATLVGEIRRMVLRSTPADYRGQIEAALMRTDQSRYLPGIKQKVLLMCGAEDSWSPVAQHEEICQRLRDAELVVVPAAGHMITMEQPEFVNKVLLSWLQDECVATP